MALVKTQLAVALADNVRLRACYTELTAAVHEFERLTGIRLRNAGQAADTAEAVNLAKRLKDYALGHIADRLEEWSRSLRVAETALLSPPDNDNGTHESSTPMVQHKPALRVVQRPTQKEPE